MNFKNALLIGGAAGTIGVASIAGVASAQSAQTASDAGTPAPGQKTMIKDADWKADSQTRQAHVKAHLDKLVTEGKMTSAQEQAIIAKLEDMATYRASLTNKTPAERRVLMQQKRTVFRQWLQDNGLQVFAPFKADKN